MHGQIGFCQSKISQTAGGCSAAASDSGTADVAARHLPRIVTADPYLYFAKVSGLLNPCVFDAGRYPSLCVVGAEAQVAQIAAVMADVTIGRCGDWRPGVLHSGCVIGEGVTLGAGSCIIPMSAIYHGCIIGQRCTIHSGAVIGADGFGLAWNKDGWLKIPQIGRVVLGNDVDVGANTTVDRGAFGAIPLSKMA